MKTIELNDQQVEFLMQIIDHGLIVGNFAKTYEIVAKQILDKLNEE